jgi:hypothetical protein
MSSLFPDYSDASLSPSLSLRINFPVSIVPDFPVYPVRVELLHVIVSNAMTPFDAEGVSKWREHHLALGWGVVGLCAAMYVLSVLATTSK